MIAPNNMAFLAVCCRRGEPSRGALVQVPHGRRDAGPRRRLHGHRRHARWEAEGRGRREDDLLHLGDHGEQVRVTLSCFCNNFTFIRPYLRRLWCPNMLDYQYWWLYGDPRLHYYTILICNTYSRNWILWLAPYDTYYCKNQILWLFCHGPKRVTMEICHKHLIWHLLLQK